MSAREKLTATMASRRTSTCLLGVAVVEDHPEAVGAHDPAVEPGALHQQAYGRAGVLCVPQQGADREQRAALA